MAYDDVLFRVQFPEFTDPTKYPAPMLTMYWSMASRFLAVDGSPCAMLSGDDAALALNMMTGHILALWKMNADSAAGGNPGSEQGGFETSASIGEISVSKLAPPVKGAWDWWLAQTPYGQMLWAFLSVMSVGGLSVGGLPEREGFRKVGGVFF